jgi:hypothetical protein
MTLPPEGRQYFYRHCWITRDPNVSYRFKENARLNLSMLNLTDGIHP